MMDIFVHNHAEQLRINREVQRKKLNVDQQEFPYPGAVQGSNNPTTVNNTSGGWVKGALLGAALLVGGGAATLALMPKAPPVAPVSPTVPTKGQDYDAVYEEQQPDGTWKLIRREHLKGMTP